MKTTASDMSNLKVIQEVILNHKNSRNFGIFDANAGEKRGKKNLAE